MRPQRGKGLLYDVEESSHRSLRPEHCRAGLAHIQDKLHRASHLSFITDRDWERFPRLFFLLDQQVREMVSQAVKNRWVRVHLERAGNSGLLTGHVVARLSWLSVIWIRTTPTISAGEEEVL
jgi:hypothetical protein